MATDLTYNENAVTVVSRINTAITEQNKGVSTLDADPNAGTVISRVNAAIDAENNGLTPVTDSDNANTFISRVNALFASIRNGGGGDTPTPTYPDAPSILILGNSFTQDSWSYVPYLLKEYGINIKVGIYYRASGSLGGLVDEFSAGIPNPPNDYNCGFYYFDTAKQSGWEERYNRPIAENCVKYYDGMENDAEIDTTKTGKLWDIIVLQQVSSMSFYHEAYGAISNLKTLIGGQMSKEFSYGFNLIHSKGGPETDLPLDIISSIHDACQNNNISIVFPYGTAIYNGRNIPDLKAIGASDGGDNLWNSDYQHLIGGIPYYLASLAIVETIFRLYYSETDLTIDGNTTMPTSSWLSSKSMPGGRGKPVSGVNIDFTKVTAANCALAQQAALDACDDNWNIEGGWPFTIVLKLTNCTIVNNGGYTIERVGTATNPATYYLHVANGTTLNGLSIEADRGYTFSRASLRSWRRMNYRSTDTIPSGSSGNISASGTEILSLDGFTPSGSILMTISPVQS